MLVFELPAIGLRSMRPVRPFVQAVVGVAIVTTAIENGIGVCDLFDYVLIDAVPQLITLNSSQRKVPRNHVDDSNIIESRDP